MLRVKVDHRTFDESESGPTHHMKIGYDANPVGEDSDTEVHLVRVRGSEGDEFTLKVRFTESAIATEKLGLGHLTKDVEKRRTIAIDKACDLIREGCRVDLIVTVGSDGKWKIEESERPLLKYTERSDQ